MARQGREDVYASLLLTDSYLPGALVLAHSLRDAGTTKKLAILVTLDTVSAEVITQLKTVYDYVIPVSRIRNEREANLYLMNRPDLHSACTKISLWRQTQFRKIVYIDADVVAYRAPDELFDLPYPFAAAPDIGWPDLFNTGVMALVPNMGDYYAMMAMAERGISFDGADQGLLNMHFKNTYHRLSFTYNVTPSAHYQYIPAYRHFQSSINMVHFIGSNKPWLEGRDKNYGNSPFDEMVGRWWAVYDRHYRKEATVSSHDQATPQSAPEYPPSDQAQHHEQHPPNTSYGSQGASSHHGVRQDHQIWASPHRSPAPEHKPEPPRPEPEPSWDAQRQPPPPDSKGEAVNFPQTHYEMSSDTTHFVAPQRYPSPPKNMWYEVPKEPPAAVTQKLKPIFPWETHRPRPSRVFAEPPPPPSPTVLEANSQTESSGPSSASSAGFDQSNDDDSEKTETQSSATTRTIHISASSAPNSDPWASFTRTNAWDEVPEIDRYVSGLQKHRRIGSGVGLRLGDIPEPILKQEQSSWSSAGGGFRVAQFPSDRPSLPVTPAPIGRKFWGSGDSSGTTGGDEDEDDDAVDSDRGPRLPAAEGVPAQAEWDPVAQLQKLAKQQSEVLLQKLGGARESDDGDEHGPGAGGGRGAKSGMAEIPKRSLPFGSEDAKSPTYVAPAMAKSSGRSAVLSPVPLKPTTGKRSPVRTMERGARAGAAAAGIGSFSDTSTSSSSPSPAVTGPRTVPEPSSLPQVGGHF